MTKAQKSLELMAAEQERRGGERPKMTQLCQSIPAVACCHGVSPWNAPAFALAQYGRSTSEKIAASFVLSVWSGGLHKKWTGLPEFSMVEAVHRCDKETIDAIRNWARNPFFP